MALQLLRSTHGVIKDRMGSCHHRGREGERYEGKNHRQGNHATAHLDSPGTAAAFTGEGTEAGRDGATLGQRHHLRSEQSLHKDHDGGGADGMRRGDD